MTKLSKALSMLALWVSMIGLSAMTLIICWQVFARYVLSDTPAWAEQAALFLMLWFILFAAAVGVREGFHIRLSILQDNLPPNYKKYVQLMCHAIVLLFGVCMTIGGGQLVVATWSHQIPTLGLPRGSAYIPIIGSGLLIAFFSIEHFWRTIKNESVEPIWS